MIRTCSAGHVTGSKICPHCPRAFSLIAGSRNTEPAVIKLRDVDHSMERGSTPRHDRSFTWRGRNGSTRESRLVLGKIVTNTSGALIRKAKHELHQFLQEGGDHVGEKPVPWPEPKTSYGISSIFGRGL